MFNSVVKSRPTGLLLGLVSISCLTFALHAHSQGAAQSGSETPYSSSSESSGASTKSSGMSSAKLSNADEKILKELAQANIAEINAGKMAEQKSENDQVKSFAKTMVDDHTKALDELKQIAQAKGVTLPTTPDSKQQAMEKKLSALSAAQFDAQYIDQSGNRAHGDTYRLLKRTKSEAKDASLKDYASKTLGTVENHQQLATQTRKELRATSEGKSGTGKGETSK